MKKSLCLLLAVCLLILPVSARASGVLYGDVNGDGSINAKDATLILRYSVGKLTNLSEYDWEAANVNADDRVNAKDATLILRYSVKKLDKFPADTHEHSYEALVTAPTCTEDGYTTYTCVCGDSYTKTVEASGHSYMTETVAPTTEAEGYDLHTCSVCGNQYKDNYTDKLPAETEPETGCTEHEYEWVCDSSWEFDTGTCKNCGETKVIYANSSATSQAVVDAINAYRKAAGLSEVQWASGWGAKTCMRATEITIQFNHLRLDGSSHSRAECIATGSNAQSVVDGWYNSSSHNGIIMNPDATHAGAAHNGIYWVVWIA